jgi:hypothetical protein
MLGQTINRVRRNHGLEHATIHVLTEKHRNFSAQGNSDHRGFSLNIYGNINESDVSTAVNEAYRRLQDGESHLAVHPNCGTVLLTTATMATLAVQGVFGIEQRRQGQNANRFSVIVNAMPAAVLMVVLALIVSRPLGIHLQARYTTEANLADLRVVSVRRVGPSLITRVFQILLTSGRRDLTPRSYRVETAA